MLSSYNFTAFAKSPLLNAALPSSRAMADLAGSMYDCRSASAMAFSVAWSFARMVASRCSESDFWKYFFADARSSFAVYAVPIRPKILAIIL